MEMSPSPWRAWIEMIFADFVGIFSGLSPSPWRAWIEINSLTSGGFPNSTSPSPWRAWIEIRDGRASRAVIQVALPVEGVD